MVWSQGATAPHCHRCPPQHAGATVWGPWQPALPVLLLVTPVPPSPLLAVRRTLKSGLSDDLVQALGLGRAPGMDI